MRYKAFKYLLLLMSMMMTLTVSADVEVNATNFPDGDFRVWILQNIAAASDFVLTDAELANVTSISCQYKGTHVRGIEYFTALKELTFTRSYSSVLYLDVSRNTALTNLSCSDNQIITLDVNKNTALTNLNCSNNRLTSLDVSNNKALTQLYCNNNKLLCLDLSNNTSLTYASINSQSSSIAALDCSEGIGIPVPFDFDFSKVSNLKLAGNTITGRSAYVNGKKYLIFAEAGTIANTIEGKQLTYTYSTGSKLSAAASMNVTVYIPKVGAVQQYYVCFFAPSGDSWNGSVPNIFVRDKNGKENTYPAEYGINGIYIEAGSYVCFRPANISADFYYSEITVNGIPVKSWSDDNISDYEDYVIDSLACDTEVELFTRLYYGNRTFGGYTKGHGNIEMYKNGKFIGVSTDYGDYKVVSEVFDTGDILKLVFVPDNGFTFSRLTKWGGGTGVERDNAWDITKDVVNNTFSILVGSNFYDEFDDFYLRTFEAYFVPTLTSSNFPDDNFRSYISSITGVAEGDAISEESLQAITTLDVSNKGIKSLEGIEFFTALEKLYCQQNQLTSLDVLKNLNLTTLDCSKNQLTSLSVGFLLNLNCSHNQLTSLDVSWQTALEVLRCSSNQLSSLDVSTNTALTTLWCDSNKLTSLDVNKNTKLTWINCSSNQLTSLDVSKNTVLTSLWCNSNQLMSLDLSKNASVNDASIGSQSTSSKAVNTSAGIAIPVPSDFDFTKVSNLKLAGKSVTGSLTTVDGQKYLVFAQTGAAQSTIDGKQLTYDYSTGNSFSDAASMDVTVSLSYAPKTITLSIQAGAGGSVSYDGTTISNTTKSFTVVEGASATISISPNSGYKLSKLKVNGTNVTSSVKDNQYTISNITANTTVVATFEQIPATTYSLSIQSGAGGSVSYDGTTITNKTQSFTVNEGISATITITPNSGYRLSRLTVNGTNFTSSVSNNKYTINNITTNTSVVVAFEQIPVTTYSLSIQSGNGGSVSYDGTTITNKTQSFTVNEGASATITITPNTGYRLSKLTVNGTNVTTGVKDNKYTINSISANTTVVATFEQITYTLSVQATGNGTVTYNSTATKNTTKTFTVNHGSSATLTISADNSYRLASLKVNGTNVTSSVSNNQYTISNITANTTVVATFEQIPITTYSLSIQSGAGGSVSYDGTTITNKTQSFTVAEGSSVTIEMTPNSGYKLESLTVNGTDVTSGVKDNSYTISNISSNTNVVATFSIITYTLSIQATGSGTVTYGSNTISNTTRNYSVDYGSSATLTFKASSGYELGNLTVGGVDVTTSIVNNSYTVSNITSNTSVVATFYALASSFTADGINYGVTSFDDLTLLVKSGNYSGHLVIPSMVTHDGKNWQVTGIESGAFKNCTGLISIQIPSSCESIGNSIFEGCTGLAAVTWEPKKDLTGTMFGSITNPNLLLFTSSILYVPYGIRNVVVNGEASEITLTDATSGNNFYSPKAFKAKTVSYTHDYSMITGRGNSQGWETIALPFDVTTIAHETKVVLKPFSSWAQGSSERPFWLYRLTSSGWTAEKQIKANTPYIISMPNNTAYQAGYNVSGQVTFSAENATVAATSAVNTSSNGSKQFVPNFTEQTSGGSIYAINANNALGSYAGSYAEGSVFTNSPARTVHPFEAYTSSTNNAKDIIPIFEALPTAIPEIPTNGNYHHNNVRIFNLSGQAVAITDEMSLQRALSRLPNGVYIVNGKKVVIK